MTDLPILKLKSLVNFPAQAFGRTGIGVVKQDGNFYIDIDYSEFVPVTVIPPGDVPNLYVLLYNKAMGVYELAPIQLVGQVYTFGDTQIITASPYLVLQNDGVIIVKRTAATVINLPPASLHNGPIHISDGNLNAGTYNITINPNGAETIVGLPSWTLAGDGAGITLYPVAGTGWFI